MTNTFAEIDRDNLAVIAVDPRSQHHATVTELGFVRSRREATARLRAAGFEPRGAWRAAQDSGRSIRSLA